MCLTGRLSPDHPMAGHVLLVRGRPEAMGPKAGAFEKGLHGFPHELAVLPSQLSTVDCLQVSLLRGFLMSGFQMLS